MRFVLGIKDLYKEIKKSNLALAAQRLRLETIEQQVLVEVISRFMDVVSKEQITKLRVNNVRVLKQHLTATQVQFELRRRTKADLAQARSRLARGKANLATASANKKKASSK